VKTPRLLLLALASLAVVAGLCVVFVPRWRTDEARAARAGLVELARAQEIYFARHARRAKTPELLAEGLIDATLATRRLPGYEIHTHFGPDNVWWATALPTHPILTGDRACLVDTSGTVFWNESVLADDPKIWTWCGYYRRALGWEAER
jgi:hypothetical protein